MSLDELRQVVYADDGMDRPSVARLARLVSDAARDGDAVAVGILEEAGAHLAELAIATLAKLPTPEAHDVFVAGGLFEAGEPLLDAFSASLRAAHREVVVRRPAFPPVIGALLMALRAAGVGTSDQLRSRLTAEIARVGIK